MVNIGKVFKRDLGGFKEVIEGQLGIKLRDIKVYPLWTYGFHDAERGDTLCEKVRNFFCDTKQWLYIGLFTNSVLAKAGNRGIYYAQPMFTKDITEVEAKQLLLHELYHEAIAVFAGYEDMYDENLEGELPQFMDEAYADFMAMRTLDELGFEASSKFYEEGVMWLEKELDKRNIKDPFKVTEFVLKYNGEKALKSFEEFCS